MRRGRGIAALDPRGKFGCTQTHEKPRCAATCRLVKEQAGASRARSRPARSFWRAGANIAAPTMRNVARSGNGPGDPRQLARDFLKSKI
jgi:hypothetical protein